ncbi:MAG: MmgE/PrpD family protein [Gemmatimonadota bacterium]|nr:MmgE/PrpD family protein [Gemmatimonadota bacterium]
MSLTGDLIDLVWDKPVRPADLSAACSYVLDAMSCAVAARHTGTGQILAAWAEEGGSGVLVDTFRVAGLVHVLEIDDLHRGSVTHPGCVVVPGAWAVARSLGRDGRSFLEAVLRGYEVMARVGASVGPAHYRLWHNTATCGPFGGAAAAGSLWDLDRERMVWSLGNAGTQASGLWEFLADGSMSKPLHAARAAEAGVTSAGLARRGFSGPAKVLEGERGFYRAMCPDPSPGRLGEDPKGPWALRCTSIKPWPSCRHTHPAIHAALELHQAVGAATVRGVTVETYEAALALCDRSEPASESDAKFSLQYCVLTALREGAVDLASFGEETRRRYGRGGTEVRVVASPEFQAGYPERWGARVTLELNGGERLTAERRACLGDPEMPVGEADLRAKARLLLQHGGMESEEAETFMAEVLGLAHAEHLPPLPA